MPITKQNRRFFGIGMASVAAVALCAALTIPTHPANAQFFGVDVGGVGIGIGTPPGEYYAPPAYYPYSYGYGYATPGYYGYYYGPSYGYAYPW